MKKFNNKALICLIYLLLLFIFVLPAMNADTPGTMSLENLIGQELSSSLLAGERQVLSHFTNIQPQLMPDNEILARHVRNIISSLNPGIMVETLNIYPKPEGAANRPWTNAESTNLYNNLLALSSLAGIEYFSASRGAMRTFYESSIVIDSPTARRAIADPFFAEPPAELTIYASQRDLTFGTNIYQYNYYFPQSEMPSGQIPHGIMIFVQENLTALSYGIIPAVSRNRLRSIVAVIDTDTHIVVYAASMARASTLPGIRDRIGSSFSNRAEAIFMWFSGRADLVYR